MISKGEKTMLVLFIVFATSASPNEITDIIRVVLGSICAVVFINYPWGRGEGGDEPA